MSYYEDDLALTKKYIKQGKNMKRTGILFIMLQVILGSIMLFLTDSLIGLLAGFALFTVGKWFIERNMEREYLVIEYIGKTVTKEYTTHGSAMGGIMRMAGMVVALIIVEAFIIDYIFPEDSFVVNYIYGIGLLWVVLHSIIRDISKIQIGEQILIATRNPDQRDILFKVQTAIEDGEQKKEKNSGRLAGVMIILVVLLLLVQSVVCWIQGASIAKELDMYDEYQTYYTKYDGQYKYESIPKLSEEWFELVTQQKGTVKYSRFKTKCAVEGTGVVVQNGISHEITMKLAYFYNETYGWRLGKAIYLGASVVNGGESGNGDGAAFESITGTWYGIGRDKTANTSDNNELTIVLEKLTDTEVSGSITCERYGETLYTKTFSGTVEVSGEFFYISATYDQEDIFYPTISFTYDSIQDIICYVDISPDTKLDRVNE